MTATLVDTCAQRSPTLAPCRASSDPQATPPALRASFDSLPIEILALVSLHFDRPTALSFACVARRLGPLADRAIWEHLELCLPIYYGTRPRIVSEVVDQDGGAEENLEAYEAEMIHEIRVKEKVAEIRQEGNDRRWRLVKRLTVVQRPSAVAGMANIIASSAAYVEQLELDGPYPYWCEASWRHHEGDFEYNSLDRRLSFHRNLHFPHLTHLRIGSMGVMYASTIVLLCEKAPNLISLEVDMNQRFELEAKDNMPRHPPPRPTSLFHHLQRVSFICDEHQSALDGEECDSEPALIEIISRSPHLRQLVANHSTDYYVTIEQLLEQVAKHPEVENFHMQMYMSEIGSYLAFANVTGFEKLERLVLHLSTPLTIKLMSKLEHLPALPMRTLHLISDHDSSPWGSFYHSGAQKQAQAATDPTYIPILYPSLSDRLRTGQRLESIYWVPSDLGTADIDLFDRLQRLEESTENLIATVSSLCHADEELLHVRLLLPNRQVADIPMASEGYTGGSYDHFPYVADDGRSCRSQVFATLPDAEWQDYVGYGGRGVPLSILEQMRTVEGISAEPERRGVEVGEAAWAVLMDWVEGQ